MILAPWPRTPSFSVSTRITGGEAALSFSVPGDDMVSERAFSKGILQLREIYVFQRRWYAGGVGGNWGRKSRERELAICIIYTFPPPWNEFGRREKGTSTPAMGLDTNVLDDGDSTRGMQCMWGEGEGREERGKKEKEEKRRNKFYQWSIANLLPCLLWNCDE